MSKIVTLAAAATGYVLGARAGRQRYEQIADQAQRLWHDPRVQKAAANAKDTAAEKAPLLKDKVAGKATSGSSDSSPTTSTTPTTV